MGVQRHESDGTEPEPSGARPVGLTVAGVARRLGVAPATLRTWDRRYGLGPSSHSAGSHRRYSPADVERLAAMRRLVLEGVAAGDAARAVRAQVDGTPPTGTPPTGTPPTGTPPSGTVGSPSTGPASGTRPRGGGRSVALPAADPAVRGLAAAALAHDAFACTDQVRNALHERGAVRAWDELVTPVLVALGDRWAASGTGIDVEHLFSEAVLSALRPYITTRASSIVPRPVVLACAEEEQHALPLHALAAALAERRVGSRILGARVPRAALADLVRRTAPAAVFVWSQLRSTGGVDQLGSLPTLRPPVPVFLGGQGWPATGLPRAAHVLTDLSSAADALSAAAGG